MNLLTHLRIAFWNRLGTFSSRPPSGDANRPKRRCGWIAKLCLMVGSIAFAIGMAEIGLRIAGVAFPITDVRDPYTGHAYRPGLEFDYSLEGRAHVRINQYGFRDEGRPVGKPPGTNRIAVLGDSYVDAVQVAEEDRFTEVMERELAALVPSDEVRIEVLNFGHTGFGTAQELMLLRHRVWQFQPDLVVLAVFTGNDIRNNVESLQQVPNRPYFVHRDGRLVLDDTFRTERGPWMKRISLGLARYSRLGQVAFRLYCVAQHPYVGTREVGLDDQIYVEPQDRRWGDAWRITEDLIRMMNAEVERHQASLLLVTLSNGIQVHPDPHERRRFMNALGVEDLFYPDRRIESLCRQERIPLLRLAPTLQRNAEKGNVFYHGFPNTQMGMGHWNERGHAETGRLIAAKVARMLRETQQSVVADSTGTYDSSIER